MLYGADKLDASLVSLLDELDVDRDGNVSPGATPTLTPAQASLTHARCVQMSSWRSASADRRRWPPLCRSATC